MLDQIHAFVMAHLVASGSLIAVVEFLLRIIPSEKPIGIIHAVSGVIHKLGDIFGGIASLLDSLVGQNIK